MKKKLTFTKREAIRLHRKMWHWLAKNPMKSKRDWPGWKDIKETIINDCFACHYVMEKGYDRTECRFCPFLWGKVDTCQKIGSPYRRWNCTCITQTEKRTKYALKVATLKIATLKIRRLPK